MAKPTGLAVRAHSINSQNTVHNVKALGVNSLMTLDVNNVMTVSVQKVATHNTDYVPVLTTQTTQTNSTNNPYFVRKYLQWMSSICSCVFGKRVYGPKMKTIPY